MVVSEPAGPTPGGDTACDPQSLSLVEIAERLEGVTGAIERERQREREARVVYEREAQIARDRIGTIRREAELLLDEQRRRLNSFDGMLGREPVAAPHHPRNGPVPAGSASKARAASGGARLNLADAVLGVWELPEIDGRLTTDEIVELLPQTGYESTAKATSMRSALNQALARLTKEGAMRRFRTDGEEIRADDGVSRARMYMPSRA